MPHHILIAEDEVDVLTFLVRALGRIKEGAHITTAKNGADALTLFLADGCDLIISDHRMPSMSGLDFLIAVRQTSQVPFIMISADSLVETHAIENGVTAFLDKPLSLHTLRNAVLQILTD